MEHESFGSGALRSTFREVVRLLSHAWLALIVLPPVSVSAQTLDETWTVTVNGQTVQVNPDGSFRVSNIASPDNFGAGGPGSAPDFLGDDFVRVIGNRTVGGVTQWAFSEPFQIRQGETFRVGELTITETPPPLPVSISVEPAPGQPSILTELGQTTQLETIAETADGGSQNVTPRTAWTVYRSSNLGVLSVDQDGLVTATGAGIGFVTAVNEGATAVTLLVVAPEDELTRIEGFVQFEDGAPAVGADVSVAGLPVSETSGAAGRFVLDDVPTAVSQSLTVQATLVSGGEPLAGSSGPLTPVPSGLTDAGIIELAPVPDTVTIGFPAPSANCFPFTCGPGTRYQQVYNQNLFAGPTTIVNVSFFNTVAPPVVINDGIYTVRFSTTEAPVNGLDETDFDANVGPDDSLFFQGLLGGPIGSTRLTIQGSPFVYDPAEGNLLIEIFKDSAFEGEMGFLDAHNGTFGNLSSRFHDFGTQFANWGLVTEFNTDLTTPPPAEAGSAVSSVEPSDGGVPEDGAK